MVAALIDGSQPRAFWNSRWSTVLVTGTTAPQFRTATVEDDERLTRLERAANVPELGHIFPPEQYPYPTGDVRARWQELLRNSAVCVWVTQDAAGLASFVAFDCELVRHLAVRPDLWGTGLAKATLDRVLEEWPVHRLWCLEQNTRALGFYEHLGWIRTGRRQRAEFPPYPFEIELVLER